VILHRQKQFFYDDAKDKGAITESHDAAATSQALAECDPVCHLAADPEVRIGAENIDSHFRENLAATFNLLDAIKKRATSTRLMFASTSTIYGEASVIPTPGDYGPLLPISTYGATKLLKSHAAGGAFCHRIGDESIFWDP
jgi:UDP-glucose 4-epimerase